MKGEYFIYHISTKLKKNDQPVSNYSHFNNPTPQMYIRAKKNMYFFLLFY